MILWKNIVETFALAVNSSLCATIPYTIVFMVFINMKLKVFGFLDANRQPVSIMWSANGACSVH